MKRRMLSELIKTPQGGYLVQNKESGNIYQVKQFDPTIHRPVSKKEAEEFMQDQPEIANERPENRSFPPPVSKNKFPMMKDLIDLGDEDIDVELDIPLSDERDIPPTERRKQQSRPEEAMNDEEFYVKNDSGKVFKLSNPKMAKLAVKKGMTPSSREEYMQNNEESEEEVPLIKLKLTLSMVKNDAVELEESKKLSLRIIKEEVEQQQPFDVKKYSNWRNPRPEDLQHEYDIEYKNHVKNWAGDVWPSYDDFAKDAAERGQVVDLTHDVDSRVGNRSHTRNKQDLLGLIKSYRSYPQYRNEKTLDSLYNGFQNNDSITMPIILKTKR
jgi:hypothetical protein